MNDKSYYKKFIWDFILKRRDEIKQVIVEGFQSLQLLPEVKKTQNQRDPVLKVEIFGEGGNSQDFNADELTKSARKKIKRDYSMFIIPAPPRIDHLSFESVFQEYRRLYDPSKLPLLEEFDLLGFISLTEALKRSTDPNLIFLYVCEGWGYGGSVKIYPM
ncbi:MAG: hypothetical protein HWN65_24470 [Candidatus Helarchaeota archaeon]|nr:hypothetical protein [Candidatus Helarchaeota archaeon]